MVNGRHRSEHLPTTDGSPFRRTNLKSSALNPELRADFASSGQRVRDVNFSADSLGPFCVRVFVSSWRRSSAAGIRGGGRLSIAGQVDESTIICYFVYWNSNLRPLPLVSLNSLNSAVLTS
ncbi:hypothetical protein L596_026212 [Steinernema carpocapsae]|uniref:Uncharacterized protein n=1 Tax=Steinernema carpocapsae TaxID=34508 RepID=A0A4U5M1P4_STECR|nr:hypothetical protein L596_026212 [Steinernema carpocapsae]